jgi:phosphoribosyl-AMP cyclohydrolase
LADTLCFNFIIRIKSLMNTESTKIGSAIDFAKNGGVVPVVTIDHASGRVLTLAYMNREAFDDTVATGRACYFSRSRNRLWRKGEESGNYQVVREIRIDCDEDTIVLAVEARGDGAACHMGYESCFYRRLDDGQWKIVEERKVDPAKYGPDYGHQKKTAV